MAEVQDHERAPALRTDPPRRWYHGSPRRLDRLAAGSTVTPVMELASAFSHKPRRLEFEIAEGDNRRRAEIRHDGTQPGYLFEVVVEDPEADLRQHPGSRLASGEELLTTRELALRFLRELPVETGVLRIEESTAG